MAQGWILRDKDSREEREYHECGTQHKDVPHDIVGF